MDDCLIISTRIIDYPRELAFKACTDPAHLANWWGPKGFTNTFHEFDQRPGGKWVYTMHGPDVGHYENEAVFEKIIPLELISWNRVSNPKFRMELLFEASGNKTKFTFRMIFDTAAGCDKLKGFVPEKNEENFDRLEAELFKMTNN